MRMPHPAPRAKNTNPPHTMRHIITILAAILACLSPKAAAELTPMWSTGIAVPGERVMLYLIDTDTKLNQFSLTKRLTLPHASVGTMQQSSQMMNINGQITNTFIVAIPVTPDSDGTVEVGELQVRYQDGRTQSVSIPPLRVLPTSEIKWMSEQIPGGGAVSEVQYGCLWYTEGTDGYVNQPVKANLKLFLPIEPIPFISPYAPQMQSVGVRVSNFEPYGQQSALNAMNTRQIGQAFARGQTWLTMDYEGEFTPFREGISEVVGKGVIRVYQGRGEMEVPIETLKLSALPLPPGAPADFADTVGEYSISAKTNASYLAMHEPVEVEITVKGSGNIMQIACPKPDDAASWKLMPSTQQVIRDARGKAVGMVYTQLMRPIAEVKGIPSFSFSYFDAKRQEYRTAATAPIPLPWKETEIAGSGLFTQAAEPPPAGEVPVEKMTDIYGYLPETSFRIASIPRALWYLLYLPAVILLGVAAARGILRKRAAGAQARAVERQLASIADNRNGLDFLKSLGAFIESHIPQDTMAPELRNILARRDEQAFRPDASDTPVSSSERSAMIRAVRKALTGTVSLLLLGLLLLPALHAADTHTATTAPDSAAAAQQAYEGKQYSRAADILRTQLGTAGQTPGGMDAALLYYNLGNCEYRLNNPGAAALSYARALQIDPGLREARANLDFIQRKEGAILPYRNATDTAFTLLTTGQLWVLTIVLTAALLFCIALIIVRRTHSSWLSFGTGLLLLGSLVCAANWGYLLSRQTPDFVAVPPADLAYIVTPCEARTAADDEASLIVKLPASTPVHLLAKRGSWSYIETALGTRGWVPTEDIRPLDPAGGEPRIPLSLRF